MHIADSEQGAHQLQIERGAGGARLARRTLTNKHSTKTKRSNKKNMSHGEIGPWK
jgi:hypothetical protein